MIIKCQGHKYSMEKRDTTVINLDAHPDQASLYRARNDPKVAAVLHSLGIKKEEQYRYEGNKKFNKLVSYMITATDGQKLKYLIKKLAAILPGFFDDNDKELIYSIIDEKVKEAGQQKREANECRNQEANLPPGPTIPEELQRPTVIVQCIEIQIGDMIFIIKIIDTIDNCA